MKWNIAHIDLSGQATSVESPEGLGTLAYLWWKDVPLGHLSLPASELPLTGQAFRNRAMATLPALAESRDGDIGAALERHASAVRVEGRPELSASVVVCTHERPDQLVRCLKSMQALSIQPAEIIVVDNAPRTEATRRMVARFPSVRYVRAPRLGLDAARNAGISAASGEVVAFADDDVVVHPNWLAGLLHGFSDARVMATTGLVLPAELDTDAQVLFETYWSFNRGYLPVEFDESFVTAARRGASVWKIGAGASMAFRRAVFARIGGFDERLDAGAAGCCGDSEMWYRILAAGWRCRYEPYAVAFHYHRRSLTDFRRQMYFYMRGHTASLLVQYEQHGHVGNLHRALLRMPLTYGLRILRAVRRGFRGPYRSLPDEIRGYLAGLVYYVRHRSDRGETTVRGGSSVRLQMEGRDAA